MTRFFSSRFAECQIVPNSHLVTVSYFFLSLTSKTNVDDLSACLEGISSDFFYTQI